MKLTKEQITYIENYIKKNDVKYYEVYMEILDHMILSVEAILENDKEISFEDAVVQAKNEGFGKKGFRGMMNEKQKLAQKQANKQNNKMIKEYFTFPKIVMTFFIFICYFLFLECFEDPRKAYVFSTGFLVFIGLFHYFKSINYLKIGKLHVLKIQMLNVGFLLFFGIFQFSISILVLGKETFDFNHILMRLFMTLVFTFSLISLLVYIEIRKQTIEEVKTQIFV